MPNELQAKLNAARVSTGMESERRIVTMLFCDVKGSTAMAEKLDPEEWTSIMNQVFGRMIEPVYQYEGTIARLMGDAILAFFGAPITHEDDPQRAVLAGLGIVEGVRPLRELIKRTQGLEFDVRVGINTGLVVVGEVGSDLRVQYTAMGDAVNLAARMEQTAQPGTVQISGNTYKLVASLFEFESLGSIEVKGKSEPIPTYRALRPKAQPGSLRGIEGIHSPLVGREHEFQILQARVDELQHGRGSIVALMAEAGLGKSRLAAELRQWSTGNNRALQWHEGRSLSYQSSTPYAPFVDLFGTLFQPMVDTTDDEKYADLKASIENLAPERAPLIAPFIATMLGIEFANEDAQRVKYLSPPQLREGIFQAVLELIELLAKSRPRKISRQKPPLNVC